MRTFDAVNCGVRRKSGKREIVRKRTGEGEILSRAIAASALVRRAREKKMSDRTESSRDIARSGPRATLSETAFTLRASKGRNPPLVITWCSGVVSMVLVYPALPTERKELVDEHEKMKVAHYRDLSGGNEVNVMSP